MAEVTLESVDQKLTSLLEAHARTDATVAELTRAQERSDQQLGEVMTLLHSIAQDVAALRGTTRVVVDADLGTTASTSDTSSSPPRQATVEDAQEIGASLAASLNRFLPKPTPPPEPEPTGS